MLSYLKYSMKNKVCTLTTVVGEQKKGSLIFSNRRRPGQGKEGRTGGRVLGRQRKQEKLSLRVCEEDGIRSHDRRQLEGNQISDTGESGMNYPYLLSIILNDNHVIGHRSVNTVWRIRQSDACRFFPRNLPNVRYSHCLPVPLFFFPVSF